MKRLRLPVGILCVFLCVFVLFACSTKTLPPQEIPDTSDTADTSGEDEPSDKPSGENTPPNETDTDNTPTEPKPPTHVHSLTFVASESATCTAAGNVAYWKCASCPKMFADESGTQEIADITIEKLGHDFVMTFTIDKAPNCTEVGSKSRHCSRCNAVTDITEIPITHNLLHVDANAATCTKAGNIEHWTCTKCPKTFIDVNGTQECENIEIPARGHAMENGACTNSDCTYVDNTACKLEFAFYDNSQESYMVTGCERLETKIENSAVLRIPNTYKGKPVVAIKEQAFANRNDITVVIISDNIQFIDVNAFYNCKKIAELVWGTTQSTWEIKRNNVNTNAIDKIEITNPNSVDSKTIQKLNAYLSSYSTCCWVRIPKQKED